MVSVAPVLDCAWQGKHLELNEQAPWKRMPAAISPPFWVVPVPVVQGLAPEFPDGGQTTFGPWASWAVPGPTRTGLHRWTAVGRSVPLKTWRYSAQEALANKF